MLKVYSCLTQVHDLRLVLLAGVVGLLAAMTIGWLLRRQSESRSRRHGFWLLMTACVTGIGVWATHFIAMLAYRPGLGTGYNITGTVSSLMAAVLLFWMAFHVARDRRAIWAPAVGGALFGLGIGVMHYTGMAAFRVEGRMIWNPVLVAASLVIGMGFGAASLAVLLRGKWGFYRQTSAALLLTGAICGLHFTGMAALAIEPDPTVHLPVGSVSDNLVAIWVGAAAGVLLFLSLGAIGVERRQRVLQERRLIELADAAVEGLVVCDGEVIITANESLGQMLGLVSSEIVGRKFAALFDSTDADVIDVESEGRREGVARSASGELIPVELICRAMPHGGGRRRGVAIRDLRDRIAAETRIRFLALNDGLTGLLNRASFNQRLEQEFLRHRRNGDAFAVLCLDLDRFKQVNDVFGHAAGDLVLKTVGERITAALGDHDIFARLGGDEFAILCLEPCKPTDLATLSERILTAVAPEIDLDGQSSFVGVSIGIALFPQDGVTPSALLRNADAALYRAKADGRGAYRFFEAGIGTELRERQVMEFDLRQALAREELKVVYQPQTSIRDGVAFGFEALIRWECRVRGNVSPNVFIPIAEETGLILPIGEWVLRQACAEAASWPNPLQVAVNLSGVQLRSPTLPALVHQVLIETGLEPGRLELEITETALVEDFHRALHTLRQIKALGVKVAMDDFGTGYSSLSNLRAFPFDKIKIDQSFVRNVHSNEQAAAIVRAIVGLGKGLNLTVLAEGVETPEELAFLTDELCAEAQGYFFGRPADIREFGGLVGRPEAPVERQKILAR